jgi:hypothetical protein
MVCDEDNHMRAKQINNKLTGLDAKDGHQLMFDDLTMCLLFFVVAN